MSEARESKGSGADNAPGALEARCAAAEAARAEALGEVRRLRALLEAKDSEIVAERERRNEALERVKSVADENARLVASLRAELHEARAAGPLRLGRSAPGRADGQFAGLQRWLASPSRPARAIRGVAKLAWWTVTLRLPQKLRERRKLLSEMALLRRSGVFDPKWYKTRYSDVGRAGADPFLHFLHFGARQSRDPGPHFSSRYYLTTYPEVAKSGVNPLIDYLTAGAAAGRNPSPDFDTAFYLATNPDVARAGVNPLTHYVKFGLAGGRAPRPGVKPLKLLAGTSAVNMLPAETRPTPLHKEPSRLGAVAHIGLDIIVPIHNAPEDVERCLDSLAQHRRALDRLILIDDGSAPETAQIVERFVQQSPGDVHLRNEEAQGYTRAVNRALGASQAPYVAVLNSDTIVTPGWAAKLLATAEADESIGLVGPLSNAASWQSVPERFGDNGDWAVNELAPPLDPLLMGRLVEAVCPPRRSLSAPLLNGFCFVIKRAVLDAAGPFDEQRFPEGYGEETDFCLRAAQAGFSCAIALDAYVYHAKSRSFTHERRRVLSRRGNEVLRETYGEERIKAATDALRHDPALQEVRDRIAATLADIKRASPPSVLFLLPCKSGGGGVHSIMQEASGLEELGARVKVAIPEEFRDDYEQSYGRRSVIEGYRTIEHLLDLAGRFDACVATINGSISLLQQISDRHAHIMSLYYVQDYEPLFYAEGSSQHAEAVRSYLQLPHAALFAKTDWIRDTIESRHGLRVLRVEPSLDSNVYFPRITGSAASRPLRISAMVRASTPRRGPQRTLDVLSHLAGARGAGLSIQIFGSRDDELARAALLCPPSIRNAGRVPRESVAALLRESDIFLDLSDYQAFGRTALEAMACGAAVIVPREGGASEFARDGVNALVVDTRDTNACIEAVERLINDQALLASVRRNALATARRYSIERAVNSELILLHAARSGASVHSVASAAAE